MIGGVALQFYSWAVLFALSIALFVFAIVSMSLKLDRKTPPSNRELSIVDLVSYTLGGASIIGFFLGSAIDESKLRENLVLDGAVVNIGDAYDPNILLPQIRSTIKVLCPKEPSCVELEAELDSWRDLKGRPYRFRIETGQSAPSQIQELIAKYNYGFENVVKPAFFNDSKGILSLLVLAGIVSAYWLGIWRRIHIVRNS